MKISREQLLDRLKRAYEMEEVMVGLLTDLAGPHVLTSKIQEQDRRKVHKMLAMIHADTLRHKKIVAKMMENVSEGSLGV